MHIEAQRLPPRVRVRVIEHRIFQHALSMARTMRDAPTVAEQAQELQTIAAIGLQAAEEARGQPEPTRTAQQEGIAQTAAAQALAAACGATVLELRAQSLREGSSQAQRFLDSTRALLPQPAIAEPPAPLTVTPAVNGRACPSPIQQPGGQQCHRPTDPAAATTPT